jgi:hypothetical protein
MIVDAISIGIGANANPISQASIVDEKEWLAITVFGGNGGPPPPPPGEFSFPWWLVGIGAVAAVAIRTRSIMKKERRS